MWECEADALALTPTRFPTRLARAWRLYGPWLRGRQACRAVGLNPPQSQLYKLPFPNTALAGRGMFRYAPSFWPYDRRHAVLESCRSVRSLSP